MPDENENEQQPAEQVVAGSAADVRRAARQAGGQELPALQHTRLHEAERVREGGPRDSVLAELAQQRARADQQAVDNNEGYDRTDYIAAAAALEAQGIPCSVGKAKSAFVWTGRQRLTHDEFVEVAAALDDREV